MLEALLAEAAAEGPGALAAARRAAALADGFDEARARKALALAARLDPLDALARLGLSRLAAEAGDLEGARTEALGVFKRSVDEAARARAAFILGEIARSRGGTDEARDAYAAAARIENALLAVNPTDIAAARWYARALGRIAELDALTDAVAARNIAEGLVAMLRALTVQAGEPPALAADIADAEFRVAVLDLDFAMPSGARRRLNEAIGRYEALCIAEPGEAHWRAVLAEAQALMAEAAFALGDAAGARAAMDKALKLRVKLAAVDPEERWALAGLWRVRAALLTKLGAMDEARDGLAHAAASAKQLLAEAPSKEAATRFLAHTLLELSDLELAAENLEAARDAADEARKLIEPFARDAAPNIPWRADLAATWLRLGEAARRANAPAQTLDAYSRAVELRRQVRSAAPQDEDAKRALAAALLLAGEAALSTQAHQSARAAFDESLSLRLEIAEAAGALDAARELAVAMERVGLAAAAAGDRQGARAMWEEELALIERVYEDHADAEGQRMRAVVESHLASLGGVDAAQRRASALARLDGLAQDGALTERDTALRRQLWQS